MKRKLSIILALMLCLSLCACGGGNDTPETTVPENSINKEEIVISNINKAFFGETVMDLRDK